MKKRTAGILSNPHGGRVSLTHASSPLEDCEKAPLKGELIVPCTMVKVKRCKVDMLNLANYLKSCSQK
jgi:hypothetical protein